MRNLEMKLGYQFKNQELLSQALTHKSYHFESRLKSPGHNEKLEYLGDAVLDLILSEILMDRFVQDGEGALSKKRASLVNENILSLVAKNLALDEYLRLGKGESQTGGANKPRLLASAFEAVVGALFKDAGYEFVRQVVDEQFKTFIANMDPSLDYEKDYKTRLQELIQKKFKETPMYELVSEVGPPHNREFEVALRVNDKVVSRGLGKSKKQAEQEAARSFLEQAQENGES